MKVLVACEESQEVCKAFRALGHEAYSCDIAKNFTLTVRKQIRCFCRLNWTLESIFVRLENGKKVLTMAEYIDREALYEKAYWHGEHPDVGNPFPDGVDAIDIKDVDAIPAADVAPVVHGRWIEYQIPPIICCSNCDWATGIEEKDFQHCPHCGAKMDGGDSDEVD